MLTQYLRHFACGICLLSSSVAQSSLSPSTGVAVHNDPKSGFVLQDSTPIKLRINRTLSSAEAKTGDQIDFEVLEEVKVNGELVISKGGTAIGTVTESQAKRRMGRGGKLDIAIDYVRLVDQEKAALRGVKETKGGGHTGAMTGAIVATSLVVWPAAPFFLFMHGKDITIPKDTEITAYINGDMPLDISRFNASTHVDKFGTSVASQEQRSLGKLEVSSTPPGADIEIDGGFVGSTPSVIDVPSGKHELAVKKNGFTTWKRNMNISGGQININVELEPLAK